MSAENSETGVDVVDVFVVLVEAKRWFEQRMDWEGKMPAAPSFLPSSNLIFEVQGAGVTWLRRMVPNCLVLEARGCDVAGLGMQRTGALRICASLVRLLDQSNALGMM